MKRPITKPTKPVKSKKPAPKPVAVVVPLQGMPTRQSVLYSAGRDAERTRIIQLVSAPMDVVLAHVDEVMVRANDYAESNDAQAPYWLGVIDAAWAFYTIRRRTQPKRVYTE